MGPAADGSSMLPPIQEAAVTSGKHAIILGASMSGLMAARVLRDHFEHVTVLERDHLPATRQVRKGVPQGNHAHGLLCSGRQALEHMFPGAVDELIAHGAIDSVLSQDVCFFNEGAALAHFPSELQTLLLSRPLLEGHLRERLQGMANVSIRDGMEAVELIATGRTVRGVRVKARGAELTHSLAAELVLDATGRGSRLSGWLEGMGFAPAPEERVRIDLRYASCVYRRRPDQAGGYKGLIAAVAPPNPRSGVVLAQEGDRWIVTLVGYLGDAPEPTHEGMREFARGLPSPAIYELLSGAEPLGEPIYMRFPFSQRRHYEQLRDFPDGLLAIGDTLCSFNPSFGQGMSVAALQALVLQSCLERGARPLWKRLFRESAKLIDTPWTIAVGADLGFPEVEGKRSLVGSLIGRYVNALRRGAVHDPKLGHAFLRVAQLLDEPSALLAPELMLRTLRASLASPKLALEGRQRESFAG
jgi:2-polyprenyl-6-methoxyphenol hydroxylase-like FAD-dependent oxidoreductase